MSTKLEEFIIQVLNATTIDGERMIISKEQANMRTFIRDCDPKFIPSIVAKLMFLDMRGENTSWGQMEVVKLMANDRTSYKRIGYLAAACMIDESNELSVLITHTMKKDLETPDPNVHSLPLALLANMGSVESCRALVSQVQSLMDSPKISVQKRAAMCATKIIRKLPEMAETFRPWVQRMLNHNYHCIVSAGINIALEMIKVDPSLSKQWTQFVTPFTKVLRDLHENTPSQEYRFSVFNDPFLQIKIMKILAALRTPSDDLDDLLASIVTNVEVRRNTGRSILFQAIQTINCSAKKPTLRSLAYNQVGRLLSFKEPNILYSSLSAFSGILYSNGAILDRTSADSVALQRYKSQVVECLDHKDGSIRRRALDVVAALVDASNVEKLVPEIMAYLSLADGDFRAELVAKVFQSVQRFAPSPEWNFQTVLNLIIDSGNYAGADVITNFCKLIGTHENLRYNATKILSEKLAEHSTNQAVVQVASWAVGEYLEGDASPLDTIQKIITLPQTSFESKCYIITAVAKLGFRSGNIEKAKCILENLRKNNNLEIQQRAGEMYNILCRPHLAEELLVPIEYEKPENSQTNRQDDTDLLSLTPDSSRTATPTNSIDDLLGLNSKTNQQNKRTDSINSLLDDLMSGSINTKTEQPIQTRSVQSPPGALEALRTSDYVIYFQIQRNEANPNQLAIRSSVYNLTETPFNQFVVQYGVPRGWQLKAQNPSGNVLEPYGGNPIIQIIMLNNTEGVPLQMRTQISYMYKTQPITEMGKINPIF